jgi:hypothetical protein
MSIVAALSGLGNPVAYYPRLAKFVRSVNAAILLSQFIYWRGKGYEGEVYKTQREIEEETGLGKEEQRTAIRKLTDMGVLTVVKKGMPAKNHFIFDWLEVDRKWAEWAKKNPQKPAHQSSGKSTTSRRESPPPVVGKVDDQTQGRPTTSDRESPRALKEAEITAETTQETTTQGEAPLPPSDGMPACIPRDAWETYKREMELNTNKTMSIARILACWKDLAAMDAEGYDARKILERCVQYGFWTFDRKPETQKAPTAGKQTSGPSSTSTKRTNYDQRTEKQQTGDDAGFAEKYGHLCGKA